MRRWIKTMALALFACLLTVLPVRAESYVYSFGGERFIFPAPSLPPYRHSRSYIASDFGAEDFSKLSGLAVGGGNVFISCGKQLIITDYAFKTQRIVTSVTEDGEEQELTDLAGIWAADDGRVYVCEPLRGRVLVFDENFEFESAFYKPEGMVLENVAYRPSKVAVDSVGRLYVVASNVYEGIVEINADGSFSRYFGQVKVVYTVMDLFWRAIQSAAQRATSMTWLPVNFSNLTIDGDGFVLATVAGENEEEPIRKLNAKGTNILRYPKDPDFVPMGDMWINSFGATVPAGPSILTSIDSTDYGVYFVFDAKRSHVFAYDEDGYLLFVFGGSGAGKGKFQNVSDMRIMGDKLVFLDKGSLSVEVFEMTEFGRAILAASEHQHNSDFTAAAGEWEKVIDYNPHFQYAYTGVGKALYHSGRTAEAEEYFKTGRNVDYFSLAFQKNRQRFIAGNFTWIFVGIIALTAAYAAYKAVRKWKRRERA
ncbi:MAG: hypothetical protein LBR83_01250 [Clostridiales bacterium]|jgi:hypothetical protein|nr:hypothetical protein [Clostridiales bacterium]